jgi:hypothetical protein
MMAFIRSVCQSVSGSIAVLRYSLSFRELYRCFQKHEANCSPQAETTISGSTYRQNMLERDNSARPLASITVIQSAKYLSLVRQLMATEITLKPLELGNPVTKSIEIAHVGYSGIGKG